MSGYLKTPLPSWAKGKETWKRPPHEKCKAFATVIQQQFDLYPNCAAKTTREARYACLRFAEMGDWDLAMYRFAQCEAGPDNTIRAAMTLLQE